MSQIIKSFSDLFDFDNEYSKFNPFWSWQTTTTNDCFTRLETNNDTKQFVIECEVPGVEKEDINVEYDSKQYRLTVDAKRKSGEDVIKSFSYSFKVDSEKINTDDYFLNLKNGILEICFPFKQKENNEVVRKLIFKE